MPLLFGFGTVSERRMFRSVDDFVLEVFAEIVELVIHGYRILVRKYTAPLQIRLKSIKRESGKRSVFHTSE